MIYYGIYATHLLFACTWCGQVMAWEEKRQVSKYADSLVQLDNGLKISPDREIHVHVYYVHVRMYLHL